MILAKKRSKTLILNFINRFDFGQKDGQKDGQNIDI